MAGKAFAAIGKSVMAGMAFATLQETEAGAPEFPGPGVLVMLETEPEWKIRKISRTHYREFLMGYCAHAKIELVHLKNLTPKEVSKLSHIETITIQRIHDEFLMIT